MRVIAKGYTQDSPQVIGWEKTRSLFVLQEWYFVVNRPEIARDKSSDKDLILQPDADLSNVSVSATIWVWYQLCTDASHK